MATTSTMTRTRTRQGAVAAALAELTKNRMVTDWHDIEDVLRFVKSVHRDVLRDSLQEQSRNYRDELQRGRDVYLRQRRRRRPGIGLRSGGNRQQASASFRRKPETSSQRHWKRLPACRDDVNYEKLVMDRLSLYCCLPCGGVTPSTACLALTANASNATKKKHSSSSSSSSSLSRFRISSIPSPACAMPSKNKRPSNHSVAAKATQTHSTRSVAIPCNFLEGCHSPLPRSFTTVFLQSAFAVDDQKTLRYVPYFGDDDREDIVSELYSTKHRERLLEYGAEYYERAVNETVDQVIITALERATTAAGEDIFFGRDPSTVEVLKDPAWQGKSPAASQNEHSTGTATTEVTTDDVIVIDGEDEGSFVMEEGDGDVAQLEEVMLQTRQPPPRHSQDVQVSETGTESIGHSREESPGRSHNDNDEDNSSEDSNKRLAMEKEKRQQDSQVWKHGLEESCSRRCIVLIHCIAQGMHLKFERVYERFSAIANANTGRLAPSKNPPPQPAKTTEATNSEQGPRHYLEAMDSYRNLFCRQCFSYDCNLHGNIKKPSLALQTRTALEKAQIGHWISNTSNSGSVEPTLAPQMDQEKGGGGSDEFEKEHATSGINGLHHRGINGNSTSINGTRPKGVAPAAAPVPDEVMSLVWPKGPRMTALDRAIGEHLFQIFEGGVDKMASAMGCGVTDVSNFVAERSLALTHNPSPALAKTHGRAKPSDDFGNGAETSDTAKEELPLRKQLRNGYGAGSGGGHPSGNSNATNDVSSSVGGSSISAAVATATSSANSVNATSMKNYNASWLRRVQNKEIRPAFVPCNHDGPCHVKESQCSCFANLNFCTKHCACAMTCANRSKIFFRGCACKAGSCTKVSCSCFAARRECDPDLCRSCGACTDPPNQPAVRQRCRNDNIGMRRHAHLLLAESNIKDAGWGIFTKSPLKRGDFVHEYLGEVISQEEAERRGWIYDKVNRSYLFNLSSDYVVDASRKGNKTKFANHSARPNCVTRMVTVNGDARVGLFAKENIPGQSELFFDYRYDVGMDNELILKPGVTVAWMKDPKMANKISVRAKHSSSSSVTATCMDIGMSSSKDQDNRKSSTQGSATRANSKRSSSSSPSKKRKR